MSIRIILNTEPRLSGIKLKLPDSTDDKIIKERDPPILSLSDVKIKTIGIKISLISIPKPKKSESSCDLFEKYIKGKRKSVYEFPTGERLKVMKGKFFYDTKTQQYAADIDGWWVSEKLDGIRAIWTGEHLLTRTGKMIWAPKWFLALLPPDIALDGELYIGRNQFHQIQSIVLDKHSSDNEWKRIQYHVFDIPDAYRIPFEDVQNILKNNLPDNNHLKVIHQTCIRDLDALLELQKMLVSQGAEGTMLRKPNSFYIVGETYHLLKFKTNFQGKGNSEMVHLLDDLAVITGYKYNLSKNRSDGKPTIKSLLVRWIDKNKFPQDPEFAVSHNITAIQKESNYEKLFPVGQKIRVLYNSIFESDKPRFPRYDGWVLDS